MTEKTVLITGCSSGIGRATAKAFLDDGWTVYATGRDEADVADLGEEGCRTAALDVTEDEAVTRVVDRIGEEVGHVDCLVNNAGYGQYGPLEDIPAERLHEQFDVNVYGPHRLIRAVLPLMRAREDGTIVNVSSVNGRVSVPGGGAYAASKFALEAMSDALRAEVDSLGVDVVVVAPGPVETGFEERAAEEVDGLDRRRTYGWVYEAFEDTSLVAGSLPWALAPGDVATVIHDAACLDDPDPRYQVGRFASYATAARYLPARLRDTVFGLVRRLM
ncbi:oxidoreductase [Halobacteriales archaeon QH_10_65_19]|nr:MAG: oxidoreductase [Halobacteriales archaeon QH_10_65_19]